MVLNPLPPPSKKVSHTTSDHWIEFIAQNSKHSCIV
jgi:hypothetical protein